MPVIGRLPGTHMASIFAVRPRAETAGGRHRITALRPELPSPQLVTMAGRASTIWIVVPIHGA